MAETLRFERGPEAIRRLLEEHTFDLKDLDLAGFEEWLGQLVARWQHDPAFAARVTIHELRRAEPKVVEAERENRRLHDEYAASPDAARLNRLDQQLSGTRKAIAGLSAAAEQSSPERKAVVQTKLELKQAEHSALAAEREALARSSEIHQARLASDRKLSQLRRASGLEQHERELDRLMRRRGKRGSKKGKSFERKAEQIVRSEILPELGDSTADDSGRLEILQNVTLGTARAEFDLLVVEISSSDDLVDVHAVVEAKRNINDIEHGFRRRQEDLAWLTGETSAYDPKSNATATFPHGHFDRETIHEEHGKSYRFGPGSFSRFRKDAETGVFLDGLYLIARTGPLWGLTSKNLGRLAYRVNASSRWDVETEAGLRRLQRWCQALRSELATPDVLRAYLKEPSLARQIVLITS